MKTYNKACVIGLILITLLSCKKTYQCNCTLYDKTTGKSSDAPQTGPTKAKNKDQAQKQCDGLEEESASYLVTCVAQ